MDGRIKQIRIYAEGVDYLPIDQLIELQGDFKTLTRENADRLQRLIEKRFISPFFVWENKKGKRFLLDGHQRSKVIPGMIEQGFTFRPCNRKGAFIDKPVNTFPIIYVYAESKKEAKENLLMISSQHGEFTDIDDFMINLDKDIIEASRLVDQEIQVVLDNEDFNDSFSLAEGGKDPFQTMTFTLADSQAEYIKEILEITKKEVNFEHAECYGNDNQNGNALYWALKKRIK